jgi:hypothetical protein
MAGQRVARTGSFYVEHGFNVQFDFGTPLTETQIQELNNLSHWLNQNFIIRVHSILDCHGISGSASIRTDLPGHEDVDILRRLRDVFSHTDGRYRPEDPDHKRLYDRIINHFGLDQRNYSEDQGKFPIPIDKVLVPIAEACKRHALAAGDSSV